MQFAAMFTKKKVGYFGTLKKIVAGVCVCVGLCVCVLGVVGVSGSLGINSESSNLLSRCLVVGVLVLEAIPTAHYFISHRR